MVLHPDNSFLSLFAQADQTLNKGPASSRGAQAFQLLEFSACCCPEAPAESRDLRISRVSKAQSVGLSDLLKLYIPVASLYTLCQEAQVLLRNMGASHQSAVTTARVASRVSKRVRRALICSCTRQTDCNLSAIVCYFYLPTPCLEAAICCPLPAISS